MLTLEQLKQAVHRKGVTKTDAVLLCVAAGGGRAVATSRLRDLAIQAGVKSAKKLPIYQLLLAARSRVFKTPDGWELTEGGRTAVAKLAAQQLATSPAAAEAQSLRLLLPKIKNPDAKDFLMESIVCAEQSLYRAAVVLSWVGAMSLLHDAVIKTKLAAFNAEAQRRDLKWRPAKNSDDLSKLKEATFLEIAQTISLLGKNVKQELDVCLKLRNGCGHPSSLKIGANKVAAHLETLALNVFSVFA